jgi:RHS repeat-associated protein
MTPRRARRSIGVLATVLLALVLLQVERSSGRMKPVQCPAGRFLVQPPDAPLIRGTGASEVDAVQVTESHRVSIDSGCPAVGGKVAARRKFTRVKVTWPSCDAFRKLHLRAKVAAPDCDLLRGRLRGKHFRVKTFTARRSICGDAVLDAAGGEECEPGFDACPADLACTEDCRCERPGTGTTTTTVPPPTTSTTVVMRTTSSTSSTTIATSTTTSTTTTGTEPAGTTTTTEPIPDPSTVAPPLRDGAPTNFAAATAFLYTGPEPVQLDVAPEVIVPRRAAVLRGTVLARDGGPLPAVLIRILDHPEFGHTFSRADGKFDMAVNGGGPLTLVYEKTGFCPAQRQVNVPWQDSLRAPDVVLVGMDPLVTAVTFGPAAPFQVAESSMQGDEDGARHTLMLFAAGTSAALVMPDGSTEPASLLHVRATEFTVGDSGPAAMPALLPPLSAYTYCVELSADEAMSAGAVSVTFDHPVITYTENFVGFPVGMAVPEGTYDRRSATWIAMPNGRVVQIVGVTDALADVDTDGDGLADAGLGITTEERRTLAATYAPGQSLWRVPVTHFSPEDANWPRMPDDATPPDGGPDADAPLEQSCLENGSIIESENQVLGESIPIVGTPYTLNYHSDRTPGQAAKRRIRLSGASVPASLASIGLHLSVAGQDVDQVFPPAPNLATTFTWNRLDGYGRPVIGGQTLDVTIDYNYPADYSNPGPFPEAFGQIGGVTLGANPTRQQVNITRRFITTIGEGLTDARTIGLGGWTLDVHHTFDPVARVLHDGGGSRRRAGSIARILTAVDVMGQSIITGVTVAPDGSVYSVSPHADTVVRIAPDGTQAIVAGTGVEGFSGDGGPATAAELGDPFGIRFAPDGSLYISEQANNRIRKVAPDGIITTVAGDGSATIGGDGGPATSAGVFHPNGIAVGPDGSLYIVNANSRIRRVGTDGIITTVAGTGVIAFSGDGGPATGAQIAALGVAAAADGTLFIADFANDRVRRVDTGGIIDTIVNYTAESGHPIAIGPNADGSLFIAVGFDGARTPRIDLLRGDGSLVTVAGGGNTPVQDGLPATQADIAGVGDVASAPDGSVWIAPFTLDASPRILHVGPAIPGFEGSEIPIASADGSRIYVFDPDGRQLRTLDALTGAVLLEFGYDAGGRLARVTEKTGGTDNVTTIEHDAAGNPTAIVAPFGQRTTLATDVNGFLSSVTNPAGEAVTLGYTATGLLTSLTDRRDNVTTFAYDEDGRLLRDEDPTHAAQTLTRQSGDQQLQVERTSALDRATTYLTEELPANLERRTVTAPDDTVSQSVRPVDGGETVATFADGSTVTHLAAPDPRFGMVAPTTASRTLHLPSGLEALLTSTRTVTLANPGNPTSLGALTDEITVAGAKTTVHYDAPTRTFTFTSPAGRTRTAELDAKGRPVHFEAPGFEPTAVTYDARGRVAQISSGTGGAARTVAFSYDAAGRLAQTTDPLGRAAHYAYDAAGRLASSTLPDGGVVGFAYDAGGNLIALTPPGRAAHSFEYDERGELIAFHPPDLAGTGPVQWTVDADHALAATARPGGELLALTYDAGGRPTHYAFTRDGAPVSGYDVSYDAAGRAATRVAPGGVTVAYGYDGPLQTSTEWSGPVAGTVARTVDGALRPATERVNGADEVAFTYDADGFIVGAGDLAIDRDAATGLPTGATLGVVTDLWTNDTFGAPTTATAQSNGVTRYAATYTRDALGRITGKVETVLGVARQLTYAYDAADRLIEVQRDGLTVEQYDYDANGNRTSASVGGSSTTATYDGQDRLVTAGAEQFIHDPSGRLVERSAGGKTTTYGYDAFGNLESVTLPSGDVVSYVLDADGRRIGKRVNGTLVQGFLYAGSFRPVAELDGAGAIVARFVYAGGSVPAYMVKGGTAFRFVTDEVGSIRLVVDAESGAIAERLDYDSFGNVTADTSPGFQPFGFAGALRDRDTGLDHMGAREYDPVTGRFTTPDPVGFASGSTNLYTYAGNDPVNEVDPVGLGDFDWRSFLGGVAYGAGSAAVGTIDAVFPGMTQSFANIVDGVESIAELAGHGFDTDPFNLLLDALDLETTVDRGSPEFFGGSICGEVAAGLASGAAARGVARGLAAGAERGLAAGAERGLQRGAEQVIARRGLQVISHREAELAEARRIDQEAAAIERAEAEAARRAAQEGKRLEQIRSGQRGTVERGDGHVSHELDF